MPGQQQLQDIDMRDDTPLTGISAYDNEGYNATDEKERVRVLAGATETAASFQFDGEDHTLGNALRYMIMKNPDVEFCGYSIPHPSEDKMNLRIQTYDNVSVYDVLEKGLNDLMEMCDVVMDKFTIAREDFQAAMQQEA
ncbi:DNA-directed RNA polymerase I and III 14 KDA polypeptide [Polyplosphaeria fusca]|uniref:DNA-directed RNA polymerases I and III subunit RPAC2 n=1 Tax=Polyplosphaeria fusca TaxID=682080 RepID=A0A9P4UZG9_9PLEO|nr:DNA-directed RNA polymerase I and III 14 KDA polypeptide [Polyplosphaeria fusca]